MVTPAGSVIAGKPEGYGHDSCLGPFYPRLLELMFFFEILDFPLRGRHFRGQERHIGHQ
ncbi:MAG: hypothetical protein ACYDIC_14150 [Desulfobaccales bacterium]